MNVQEIQLLPAHRLSEMIQNREISCLELTNALLEKIEKENDNLNTFLYINVDGAREMAKKGDEMVSKKEFTKPLLGIPISVPDALNMLNRPTTFGSLLLKDHIAVDDAIEIEQLKNAGSIILGKTNMAEFGLHYETANRLRDPCRNPLNTQFSPGGGSGGSAASVASGQATIALGDISTVGNRWDRFVRETRTSVNCRHESISPHVLTPKQVQTVRTRGFATSCQPRDLE